MEPDQRADCGMTAQPCVVRCFLDRNGTCGPAAARSATRRVDPNRHQLHMLRIMTVWKRLLTLGLALAFLVGMTAQLMPPSMAETSTTVTDGTSGCCDDAQPPCRGHLPNCLDHGGCISLSALPASPATIAVQVEWTLLAYGLASQALAGISIKPELSPPILVV